MGCRESVQLNSTTAADTGNVQLSNRTTTLSSKGVILVYGMTQSMATQRVMATLTEKGLKFELKVVNLAAGEHKTQAYLEKQPFGVIPVLVDDNGITIYESRAICRYLELKYRGQGTELIPRNNSTAEGQFEQAVSIESSYFDPYANEIVDEKLFKKLRGGGEPDMNNVANLRRQLSENLDIYERILSKQPYLGGQTFTLADLFHLPYGEMLVKCGDGDLFESRAHVRQWWNKISSRPAWRSVLTMQ